MFWYLFNRAGLLDEVDSDLKNDELLRQSLGNSDTRGLARPTVILKLRHRLGSRRLGDQCHGIGGLLQREAADGNRLSVEI